jgi:hypothetical protein
MWCGFSFCASFNAGCVDTHTLWDPEEPVVDVVGVSKTPWYCTRRSKGGRKSALPGPTTGAGDVKRRDVAFAIAYRTMTYVHGVNEVGRGGPRGVESYRNSTLEVATARARRIERLKAPVRRTQTTVIGVVPVKRRTRDHPLGINRNSGSSLTWTCTSSRIVEFGEASISRAYVTMIDLVVVGVPSRDRSFRVDA